MREEKQSFPFYLLASREHFDPPDIESGRGGIGCAGKDAINDATVGLERLRCEVARCTLGVVVVDTEVIADGRALWTRLTSGNVMTSAQWSRIPLEHFGWIEILWMVHRT